MGESVCGVKARRPLPHHAPAPVPGPQVACMQFINIVVHSVENMNFRVFLQYEFTHLGLDLYLEVSPALPLRV